MNCCLCGGYKLSHKGSQEDICKLCLLTPSLPIGRPEPKRLCRKCKQTLPSHKYFLHEECKTDTQKAANDWGLGYGW